MHLRALIVGLVLVAVTATTVATEEQRPAQQPPPAGAPQQPALPVSLEQALYLIRSTLLSLNDANRTGNYTVLRDLAAPDFQAANTAADLALNFTDLRRRNIALAVQGTPLIASAECGLGIEGHGPAHDMLAVALRLRKLGANLDYVVFDEATNSTARLGCAPATRQSGT